jgi:hypothetical protein
MADNVNHPSHYNQGKIEVIEFLEDQFFTEPHLWTATKYLARAGKKDPSKFVEDLEKAIWYIRRRIELESAEPRRPNDMAEKVEVPSLTDSARLCDHPEWTRVNALEAQCLACGKVDKA